MYMWEVEEDNLGILFQPQNPHLPEHLGESERVLRFWGAEVWVKPASASRGNCQ